MIVSLANDPDIVAVVPTLAGNLPRLRACIDSVCASEIEERLAIVVVWNDPRVERVDLGSFKDGLDHSKAEPFVFEVIMQILERRKPARMAAGAPVLETIDNCPKSTNE